MVIFHSDRTGNINNSWLVVTGTWLDYDFPETVGNGIIIPTDELIFFRGVGQPPTRL